MARTRDCSFNVADESYRWLSYHVEMGRFLRVLAVVICVAASLAAQTTEGATLKRWNQEAGFWGAYSPGSNIGIGKARYRKFFELNGQYAVTVLTRRHVGVKWVSEVVPLALLNEPTEFYRDRKQPASRAGATTYAGGLTPLGMQVNFRNGHRVQPFFDAHGGMLYFTRQEPVPNSSQFNFTFNFGAGVQVFSRRRSSLLLGYKYHHISNNETAPQNPGIDSSEFYAGYLWKRK
jgi:hypothetical protein